MDWRAGIWFEHRLQMNSYSVTVDLMTNTRDQNQQIIAMARLKHFVYLELDSTVFVNQNNHDAIDNLTKAGINVTTLPEDPIDQIIGIMLFYKLNAIMEDRILVRALDIASDLGDQVHYLHSDQESTLNNFGLGWWYETGPGHGNTKKSNVKKNVVKLQRSPTWLDFDLDWQSDNHAVDNTVSTIVKFHKDES